MTLNQTIGSNIKNLRTKTNMTQDKLAEMLGVSVPTMSLYEKGERSVPHESLVILSRIFNVTIDNLYSISSFEKREEHEIFFEHFTIGSTTVSSDGETLVSNPYSMYFTLTDTNGDTLVFLRTNEVTSGVMLVSESHILSKQSHKDIDKVKSKRLFLSNITLNERTDGREGIYTYTDHLGNNFVMKNKSMFIYYGFLIARINHIAKTEEFFFHTKS